MLSESKAKSIAENKANMKATECVYYKDFYVFIFGLHSTKYLAVSKTDGKVYPFVPSMDLVNFANSRSTIYTDQIIK